MKITTRADDKDQTRTRYDLGFSNNDDMFLHDIRDFLKQYAPCKVQSSKVAQCIKRLLERENPILQKLPSGKNDWVPFEFFLGEQNVKLGYEDKAFEPLQVIIDAIFEEKDPSNRLRFILCPKTKMDGDIDGGDHLIDACFTNEEYTSGKIAHRAVRAPIEFKKHRTDAHRDQAHRQILGACHHILNEDPRRMFIYGMTFERDQMSVWYFSRSHSVKTYAFNYFEEPEIFIEVMLSLAYATPAELGMDPYVHNGPISGDKKTMSYIYEIPGKYAGGSPVFLKTGRSRFPDRPMCIAGRVTRVWEVTEVTSKDGKDEVNPGSKLILKDVWLDAGAATEAENMDKIFEDVDRFVAERLTVEFEEERKINPNVNEADPDTISRLTRRFIDKEPMFRPFGKVNREMAFDVPALDRLQAFLTGRKYRSLFLTKLYAYKGAVSKELGATVRQSSTLFSIYKVTKNIPDPNAPRALPTYRTSSIAAHPYLASANDTRRPTITNARDQAARCFVPKQQSRFVYQEVCTNLHQLPTLGEAFDVLAQTLDALKILFCAGWVHRDLSVGNILAFPDKSKTSGWSVKLADLEFSRLMIDADRKPRSDPRTGTPFFMPTEILRRNYFFETFRGRIQGKDTLAEQMYLENEDEYTPFGDFRFVPFSTRHIIHPANRDLAHIPARSIVNHNFQHDLESIWWIALWLVTMCVGSGLSTAYADDLFSLSIENFKHREIFLKEPIDSSDPITHLEPKLQKLFPSLFEDLRGELHQSYVMRPLFGHLNLSESYAKIHALFDARFQTLIRDTGSWKQMAISHKKVDVFQYPATIVAGKRPRDEDGNEETLIDSKRPRV